VSPSLHYTQKPIIIRLIAAQEENAALKDRVRLLEQAIRRLQAVGGQPAEDFDDLAHPTSSSSNRFLDSSERTTGSDSGTDGEDDGLDAFGKLSVFDEGASTFHGRYAHTEVRSRFTRLVTCIESYTFFN
jgi:hypothetical protein